MFYKQISPIIVLLLQFLIAVNCSCPKIIPRADWNAAAAKSTTNQRDTPPYVVVHHSETSACNSERECKNRVKSIQDYHMNSRGWNDIGYNFLIGGDGNVYQARGWGKHGAHAPKYNSRSIGICMIGNFMQTKPPQNQLDALKNLIECGVSLGKITQSYHLVGHRQGQSTDCPGNILFNEITTWPHFDRNPSK